MLRSSDEEESSKNGEGRNGWVGRGSGAGECELYVRHDSLQACGTVGVNSEMTFML
jgi:hypothetical protein